MASSEINSPPAPTSSRTWQSTSEFASRLRGPPRLNPVGAGPTRSAPGPTCANASSPPPEPSCGALTIAYTSARLAAALAPPGGRPCDRHPAGRPRRRSPKTGDHTSRIWLCRALRAARPTEFEPVTFGSVERRLLLTFGSTSQALTILSCSWGGLWGAPRPRPTRDRSSRHARPASALRALLRASSRIVRHVQRLGSLKLAEIVRPRTGT